MKKRLLVIVSVLGLLSVLAFAGCGRNEQEASGVKIVEEEVVVKAAENEANNEVVEENANVNENKNGNNKSDIEVLEEKVNKVLEKAQNAVPENDYNKNREKFFELKNELDRLDAELEFYEEELEGKHYSGKLSKDKYRSLNLRAERLEEKLDLMEDDLEYRFGIDD